METAKEFYCNRLEELTIEYDRLKKKSRIILIARLLSFLLIVASLYCFGISVLGSLFAFIAGLIFLKLVAGSVDLKHRIKFNNSLISINQSEIIAIDGNWSFDSGVEFESSAHNFSSDLDLFVEKGVFSFLNRTSTLKAKKAFANLLLDGNPNKEKFQLQLMDLVTEIKWTQEFRAHGESEEVEEDWATAKSFFELHFLTKIDIVLFPLIFTSLFVLIVFGIVSVQVLFSYVSIMSVILLFRQKKMNLIAASFLKNEEKGKVMLKRAELLLRLSPNKMPIPSTDVSYLRSSMHKYLKICNLLNARNNLLVNFILNLLVGLDSYLKIKILQWEKSFESKIEGWEKELVDVELLICAATIKYNYPTTIHPDNCEENRIEVQGLSHPLIHHLNPVINDFELADQKSFYILTGPNMAGKSTYLRSIGLAIVFANAGLPVFADKMNWSGFTLMTSMRNKDDINTSSSYFYSELKRLKFIVDTIENKGNVIILLDEILKGTNSKDKQEGSAKFLLKLKRLGAKGVIATHDLKLCELENEYFENRCFDSEIKADQLHFDYKIRKGICKNMNASFLMKKMNLIDD